jgi:LemA protein
MKNKGLIVGLIIVGGLVFIGMLTWINSRNKLVELEENAKAAWAQVESQLQRRMDLIPNLVETVKGYASHEERVLTEVTVARASVAGASGQKEKIDANNQLSSALARLLVVVEKYPDLKANTNFLALQDELAGTENRISTERRRYNDAVGAYNKTRRKFPYMFFAGSFDKMDYFEAEAGAKVAPKVKF